MAVFFSPFLVARRRPFGCSSLCCSSSLFSLSGLSIMFVWHGLLLAHRTLLIVSNQKCTFKEAVSTMPGSKFRRRSLEKYRAQQKRDPANKNVTVVVHKEGDPFRKIAVKVSMDTRWKDFVRQVEQVLEIDSVEVLYTEVCKLQ